MNERNLYRIYIIVCEITGETYIGCTKRELDVRLYFHIYDATRNKKQDNSKKSKCIRENKPENFSIKLMMEIFCTEQEIKEIEKRKIEEYNSYNNGLNSTRGERGRLSKETIVRIKEELVNGIKIVDIANKLKLEEYTIQNIKRGISYSNIRPDLNPSLKKSINHIPKYEKIEQVAQINKHTKEIINIYESSKDAAKAINPNSKEAYKYINGCIRNDKPAYGFLWDAV